MSLLGVGVQNYPTKAPHVLKRFHLAAPPENSPGQGIVSQHQRCGHTGSPFARKLFYDAGSSKGLEGGKLNGDFKVSYEHTTPHGLKTGISGVDLFSAHCACSLNDHPVKSKHIITLHLQP